MELAELFTLANLRFSRFNYFPSSFPLILEDSKGVGEIVVSGIKKTMRIGEKVSIEDLGGNWK